VLSSHGAFHPVIFSKSNRLGKKLYLKVAIPMLYRKALFHSLTPYQAEQGDGMFPFAHWYVAPNGPSLMMEQFLSTSPAPHRVASDPIRLLFVGRMHVHTKGLDLLFEALALALRDSQTRRCHLTLVGPDYNQGRIHLERQAARLGITPYVEFAGVKLGKELAAAYCENDVYIQTSRHEGQSLAATDALLFGMPAILTKSIALCSYPEVAHGSQVLLVPPQVEDIARAIADLTQRVEEMHQRAEEELPRLQARFSWEAVTAIHREQYEKLVADRARDGRTGSR
jgi:glycosyltransferase involved in cell wall biosynthesis